MKQYRVEIKPTAENDLENRYLQIAEESPQNAVSWYLDMISAIEKLDTLAERCPIAPEDVDIGLGIRHLIIGNYRVLYSIRNDIVEVLHIRHGRHDRKL
ncbi:MAG: type II toxin-antitoxin system RelE/ParE family toxin [Shewanella sp.]|nr:type II toxin-antitoxin system RelE/ParE family toxin [Shewanella sp.]MCG7935441.1 type II toxin-antitoxin system RelE/ParE family toxin [Candidatus Thiodiazotropha taylori]